MSTRNQYRVYEPPYSLFERGERWFAISQTLIGAYLKIRGPKSVPGVRSTFGASVEITDRCNAGCEHCYVYPSSWDQSQRMTGYLGLEPTQRKTVEGKILETLDKLKKEGIVHVTLVGGEPLLFPKAIYKAGSMFPVVWVVTNGAAKFPRNLPRSVVMSVSIDGPPDYHNQLRDPAGFFNKQKYKDLSGMSAAIVRNINESQRGAFVHITLTPNSLNLFPEAVEWFIKDIEKLRGIMVSGAATQSKEDPNYITPENRLKLKLMVENLSLKYGPHLFPFNQPKVNQFLFDEKYIIKHPSSCTVARRVDSYNFEGNIVGKCVLRDATDCETCVCNLTGLMRGVAKLDTPTIYQLLRTCYG
jgi:sulfatase maturation enzyme AslB (radical SAM superfamily)